MEVEEARKWIGKDSCIHWDDPMAPEGKGGMSGVVAKVERVEVITTEYWLVVDWGWGALVEAITAIHLTSEPCPQQ